MQSREGKTRTWSGDRGERGHRLCPEREAVSSTDSSRCRDASPARPARPGPGLLDPALGLVCLPAVACPALSPLHSHLASPPKLISEAMMDGPPSTRWHCEKGRQTRLRKGQSKLFKQHFGTGGHATWLINKSSSCCF